MMANYGTLYVLSYFLAFQHGDLMIVCCKGYRMGYKIPLLISLELFI